MSKDRLTSASVYEQISSRGKAEFIVRHEGALRYDQLLRAINGCCALFDASDAVPGDRVLIVTEDDDVAISAFLAALLDGLVPAIMNSGSPAPRLKTVAKKISPAISIVDAERQVEEWARRVVQVNRPTKTGFWGRTTSPSGFWAEVSGDGRAPRLPDDAESLGYLLFTSGTTSESKAVMIRRSSLLAHLQTLSRLFAHNEHSRIFNGLAFAHADGLVQGPLLAAANGGAVIRPGPFDVGSLEPWLNSIRALRATHMQSVPTVYALINRLAAHDDYFDAPEFRCLISSAAKLDEDLWRRLETRFGKPVFNEYGLTETVACGLYAGPHPEMGPIGTIGKPVDIKVRLLGLDGTDIKSGEFGEIALAGENVFAGYWDEPKLTAEVMTADGWFRTGDLGSFRSDGSVELVGRLKTVILCGGLLIRPEEIDEALLAHPAVVEVATIGIPDSDFGEIPVSAVVLGERADGVDLTEHCRTVLEPNKVPRRVVAVDKIPRGDAGKPKFDELRKLVDSDVSPVTEDFASSTIQQSVLEIASFTFRTPLDALALDSSNSDIAEWDSFAHLSLILNAERRFGVRISTADVAAIKTLSDLMKAIERAQ